MISLIEAIAMPKDSAVTTKVRYCRPCATASCITGNCFEPVRISAPMTFSRTWVALEPDEFLRLGLSSCRVRLVISRQHGDLRAPGLCCSVHRLVCRRLPHE